MTILNPHDSVVILLHVTWRSEGVITCSLPGKFTHLYEFLLPGHYLENSLICMMFQSSLLTVWFAAHFILCLGMISAQT